MTDHFSINDEDLMFAMDRASDALGVILLDPKIRKYLLENDPKAFDQAKLARKTVDIARSLKVTS